MKYTTIFFVILSYNIVLSSYLNNFWLCNIQRDMVHLSLKICNTFFTQKHTHIFVTCDYCITVSFIVLKYTLRWLLYFYFYLILLGLL